MGHASSPREATHRLTPPQVHSCSTPVGMLGLCCRRRVTRGRLSRTFPWGTYSDIIMRRGCRGTWNSWMKKRKGSWQWRNRERIRCKWSIWTKDRRVIRGSWINLAMTIDYIRWQRWNFQTAAVLPLETSLKPWETSLSMRRHSMW